MENCSNEYILKSNVRNILYHHPQFMECDASVNHDDVIAVLWAWSYHCYGHDVSDQANDHARLLELMRLELGDEAVEDIDNCGHSHFYKLRLPNATWYVNPLKLYIHLSLERSFDIYDSRDIEVLLFSDLLDDARCTCSNHIADQVLFGLLLLNLINKIMYLRNVTVKGKDMGHILFRTSERVLN